jgi:hypothetical protein
MSFAPRAWPLAAAVALLAMPLAAESQYPQGRTRRDSPAGQQKAQDRSPVRASMAPEPILALEHELPSLKVDLALAAEQLPDYDAFARALRDVAELARRRARKLMAPPAVDAPAPSAMQVIAGLAEDDRMRSEAMADLVAKLKVLYDGFSPKQRTLFDRRVLLAQSEPLGTQ